MLLNDKIIVSLLLSPSQQVPLLPLNTIILLTKAQLPHIPNTKYKFRHIYIQAHEIPQEEKETFFLIFYAVGVSISSMIYCTL